MSEEKANKFAAKASKKGGITVDVDKGKITNNKPEKAAKTEKAAKPAKVKKAASDEDGKKGRPSPYAGQKIKKLAKEHGARDGSIRAALMDAIMGAKNTDDVLGKEVEAGDKTGIISSADIRFAVEQKFISLS